MLNHIELKHLLRTATVILVLRMGEHGNQGDAQPDPTMDTISQITVIFNHRNSVPEDQKGTSQFTNIYYNVYEFPRQFIKHFI